MMICKPSQVDYEIPSGSNFITREFDHVTWCNGLENSFRWISVWRRFVIPKYVTIILAKWLNESRWMTSGFSQYLIAQNVNFRERRNSLSSPYSSHLYPDSSMPHDKILDDPLEMLFTLTWADRTDWVQSSSMSSSHTRVGGLLFHPQSTKSHPDLSYQFCRPSLFPGEVVLPLREGDPQPRWPRSNAPVMRARPSWNSHKGLWPWYERPWAVLKMRSWWRAIVLAGL